MSVDDFCRATRRLRDEVPIPAKNRVAIGVIRPRAVKIDRLVDPRLLVGTGVRHWRLICRLLYRCERIHIACRYKPLRKTPRLPTIRAAVDFAARVYPCKDNSATKVCERQHTACRSKPLHKTPRLPTIRATVDFAATTCPCKDYSGATLYEPT